MRLRSLLESGRVFRREGRRNRYASSDDALRARDKRAAGPICARGSFRLSTRQARGRPASADGPTPAVQHTEQGVVLVRVAAKLMINIVRHVPPSLRNGSGATTIVARGATISYNHLAGADPASASSRSYRLLGVFVDVSGDARVVGGLRAKVTPVQRGRVRPHMAR